MKLEKHSPIIKIRRKIKDIPVSHPVNWVYPPAIPIKTTTYLAISLFFAKLKSVFLTLGMIPAKMQEKALTEYKVTLLLSERH